MGDTELRRKHIETLEVLQALSDENEQLKRNLHNTKEGESLDTAENNDRLLSLLTERREEVKRLQTMLAEEKKRTEVALTEAKKQHDTTKNMMKEMEAQQVLLDNLRSELDAVRNSPPPRTPNLPK